MKKIIKYNFLFILVLLSACSDFLDETPDDRTLVNSKDKVRKLLVSAYPESSSVILTELSSDNTLDEGDNNPNGQRAFEQMMYWKDVTGDFDSPLFFWEKCYNAISNANLALSSIENIKGENLVAEKAEALITRAYNHFLLVNVFAKHYNPATANTDLGITYMSKSETELNPKYKRNTVAEVYSKIEADLERALPNISDDMYDQPKFHFNKNAAYAFASRFYLYYGKWDKALKYADKVLGATNLINWGLVGAIKSDDANLKAKELTKDKGALLLLSTVSFAGPYFGKYDFGARINHVSPLSKLETLQTKMPWAEQALDPFRSYKLRPLESVDPNNKKVFIPKRNYYAEFTDAVSGIGRPRSVFMMFTTDEVLLIRAEANIHLGNYDKALADLNKWTKNFFKEETRVTLQQVQDFYNKIPYSDYRDFAKLTQKKKLNPVGFEISDKNQENMLHFLLQCRRILTIHDGLRWYDIKRYGIEVPRFKLQKSGWYDLVDILKVNDNRRALQLPKNVISSGLTPNPR